MKTSVKATNSKMNRITAKMVSMTSDKYGSDGLDLTALDIGKTGGQDGAQSALETLDKAIAATSSFESTSRPLDMSSPTVRPSRAPSST